MIIEVGIEPRNLGQNSEKTYFLLLVNTSKTKEIDVAEILGFFLFRVIFGLLTDQKNGPSPQYRVLCEIIF